MLALTQCWGLRESWQALKSHQHLENKEIEEVRRGCLLASFHCPGRLGKGILLTIEVQGEVQEDEAINLVMFGNRGGGRESDSLFTWMQILMSFIGSLKLVTFTLSIPEENPIDLIDPEHPELESVEDKGKGKGKIEISKAQQPKENSSSSSGHHATSVFLDMHLEITKA
eukprot:Gb_01503 [translate_table: standard]